MSDLRRYIQQHKLKDSVLIQSPKHHGDIEL